MSHGSVYILDKDACTSHNTHNSSNFFRVILFSYEEDGLADDLDVETESFVDTPSEAEEVAKGASTSEEIGARRVEFRVGLNNSTHYGCHWIFGIHSGVGVTKVLPIVLWQTPWCRKWCPLRRFSYDC